MIETISVWVAVLLWCGVSISVIKIVWTDKGVNSMLLMVLGIIPGINIIILLALLIAGYVCTK